MLRTISLSYERIVQRNYNHGVIEFISTLHNFFIINIFSSDFTSFDDVDSVLYTLRENGMQKRVCEALMLADKPIPPCAIFRGPRFLPHCPCLKNFYISAVRNQADFVAIQQTLLNILTNHGNE